VFTQEDEIHLMQLAQLTSTTQDAFDDGKGILIAGHSL